MIVCGAVVDHVRVYKVERRLIEKTQYKIAQRKHAELEQIEELEAFANRVANVFERGHSGLPEEFVKIIATFGSHKTVVALVLV